MKAGFWEILLIVILVLVLFGHSKIPDMMKNLAAGINVFKSELKKTDDNKSEKKPDEKTTAVKKSKPVSKKKPVAKKKAVK